MNDPQIAQIALDILGVLRWLFGGLVVAAFGTGGFFALTHWRLGRIEKKLEGIPTHTAQEVNELKDRVHNLEIWRASMGVDG